MCHCAVIEKCVNNAGRYVQYLPSVASSVMEYLGLGKSDHHHSDVFFNRIRVCARELDDRSVRELM